MDDPTPGACIDLPGAANFRDLGGWSVSGGGVTAHGQVYRSTELNGLMPQGLSLLESLGLRTVFDLRTSAERDAQPDRLPAGVTELHLDVLADDQSSVAAGAASLVDVLSDPAKVEAFFASNPVDQLFVQAYRDVVSLPSALRSYRQMFGHITDLQRRPILFHCTTGKDRAGWGSAALLSFLGVSHDDVMAEYLLTNDEILPLTQPMYDAFEAAGGDPSLLRPALGVEPAYLDTAFEEMESRFGSIEGYFERGLGLPDDTLDALRSAMVSPSG
ncbi:MAG: tyrosine-protein phosphatase [Acidimicrobiales bacterium]|nr:tyrosine-protein phosphatase [Acidimicrobiales bacterium]